MRTLLLLFVVFTLGLFITSCSDDIGQEEAALEFESTIEIPDSEKGTSKLIPGIKFESVQVNPCWVPGGARYYFRLEMCEIWSKTESFHVYAQPPNGGSWIHLGVANQVGSNDFLFSLVHNTNVAYIPGTWTITGKYSFVDPSELYDCEGSTSCNSCHLFFMPAPFAWCK